MARKPYYRKSCDAYYILHVGKQVRRGQAYAEAMREYHRLTGHTDTRLLATVYARRSSSAPGSRPENSCVPFSLPRSPLFARPFSLFPQRSRQRLGRGLHDLRRALLVGRLDGDQRNAGADQQCECIGHGGR